MKKLFLSVLTLPVVAVAVPQADLRCPTAVVDIPGVSETYFDRDCKTLYVLPPAQGRFQIDSDKESPEFVGVCQKLDGLFKEHNSAMSEYFDKSLKAIDATEEERQRLDREAEEALKRADNVMAQLRPLSNTPLRTVEFSTYSDGPALVSAMQAANPNLNVKAMPLGLHNLGIVETNESNVRLERLPAVLKMVMTDAARIDVGSYHFHEGARGVLVLAASGACPKPTAEELRAYLVGNLTRSYWVATEWIDRVWKYQTAILR